MTDVASTPIGRAKGPGPTPHSFTFIAPDKEQVLKIGEFVTYEATVDGRPRLIFSRITLRQPLRLFPDDFSSDPEISPEEVAALMGYHEGGQELFELTAAVIGYYDDVMEDFINPRLPPRMGWAIYLADDEALARVLSKRRLSEVGGAHIGYLLSRNNRVPIVLNVASFTSTHLSIIGSTGGGKSYLAALLVEQLMMSRAAVLIIDPHGEYDTLAGMNSHPAFSTPGYRPFVQVLKPGEVKLKPAALSFSDLKYLLPDLSERMEYLLSRAYNDVRRQSKQATGHSERWTREELIQQLRNLGSRKGSSRDEDESLKGYASTAEALIWRLEAVFGRAIIFDDVQDVSLQSLCRPGYCSILQLHEVSEKEQQVFVAAILRRLLYARIQTEKKRIKEGHELYLPYPVFVLIEEAHRFAPSSAATVSTPILKEVLSEGRKFGIGVGVISQRPGKLDSDVLSQCNTSCLLRIVNPRDQEAVIQSIESVGAEFLKDELVSLSKGQAIIGGHAINTPVLCAVGSRLTPHGADSKSAPAEWMAYHTKSAD